MGSRMWVPTVSGPLAAFSAGFESWLLARGYSPWTVSHRLWQLDLLSRWLEREGLGADDLTAERAELFVRGRRAAGWGAWVSASGLRVPLGYLREIGVARLTAPTAADGPVEELLAAYRRYLVVERGRAEMTVYHCERAACVFLEDRLEQTPGVLELERQPHLGGRPTSPTARPRPVLLRARRGESPAPRCCGVGRKSRAAPVAGAGVIARRSELCRLVAQSSSFEQR